MSPKSACMMTFLEGRLSSRTIARSWKRPPWEPILPRLGGPPGGLETNILPEKMRRGNRPIKYEDPASRRIIICPRAQVPGSLIGSAPEFHFSNLNFWKNLTLIRQLSIRSLFSAARTTNESPAFLAVSVGNPQLGTSRAPSADRAGALFPPRTWAIIATILSKIKHRRTQIYFPYFA